MNGVVPAGFLPAWLYSSNRCVSEQGYFYRQSTLSLYQYLMRNNKKLKVTVPYGITMSIDEVLQSSMA